MKISVPENAKKLEVLYGKPVIGQQKKRTSKKYAEATERLPKLTSIAIKLGVEVFTRSISALASLIDKPVNSFALRVYEHMQEVRLFQRTEKHCIEYEINKKNMIPGEDVEEVLKKFIDSGPDPRFKRATYFVKTLITQAKKINKGY